LAARVPSFLIVINVNGIRSCDKPISVTLNESERGALVLPIMTTNKMIATPAKIRILLRVTTIQVSHRAGAVSMQAAAAATMIVV
jgi:hypothetical protein